MTRRQGESQSWSGGTGSDAGWVPELVWRQGIGGWVSPRTGLGTADRNVGGSWNWSGNGIYDVIYFSESGLETVNWRIMGLRTGMGVHGSLGGFEIPSGNHRQEGKWVWNSLDPARVECLSVVGNRRVSSSP
jgi:hypothetical protein